MPAFNRLNKWNMAHTHSLPLICPLRAMHCIKYVTHDNLLFNAQRKPLWHRQYYDSHLSQRWGKLAWWPGVCSVMKLQASSVCRPHKCMQCSVVSDSLWPPRTVAHQAPLSTGFSQQEYWSGLPFPPSADLPNPEIQAISLTSPTLQVDSHP